MGLDDCPLATVLYMKSVQCAMYMDSVVHF